VFLCFFILALVAAEKIDLIEFEMDPPTQDEIDASKCPEDCTKRAIHELRGERHLNCICGDGKTINILLESS
jgi:hypothetical protein